MTANRVIPPAIPTIAESADVAFRGVPLLGGRYRVVTLEAVPPPNPESPDARQPERFAP